VAAASPPRISVVIPVLNEAGCITRLLDELQAMRRRGQELVVVDGGSHDGTVAASRLLADRVVEAPRGRASQMRAGAAVATGSVVWFLHADTLPAADADLLILKECMQGGDRWGRFDVRFSRDRFMLKVVAFLMNLRARFTGIATGDQGIFMTRVLYEKVGGMPAIPLMEDVALSCMLKRYRRPAVIRQKLVASPRRWEKHGVARTILTMWGLRLAYFFGVAPSRLAKYYAVHKT
jgi:rSAM/selenodomain-associated transferase 2